MEQIVKVGDVVTYVHPISEKVVSDKVTSVSCDGQLVTVDRASHNRPTLKFSLFTDEIISIQRCTDEA